MPWPAAGAGVRVDARVGWRRGGAGDAPSRRSVCAVAGPRNPVPAGLRCGRVRGRTSPTPPSYTPRPTPPALRPLPLRPRGRPDHGRPDRVPVCRFRGSRRAACPPVCGSGDAGPVPRGPVLCRCPCVRLPPRAPSAGSGVTRPARRGRGDAGADRAQQGGRSGGRAGAGAETEAGAGAIVVGVREEGGRVPRAGTRARAGADRSGAGGSVGRGQTGRPGRPGPAGCGARGPVGVGVAGRGRGWVRRGGW